MFKNLRQRGSAMASAVMSMLGLRDEVPNKGYKRQRDSLPAHIQEQRINAAQEKRDRKNHARKAVHFHQLKLGHFGT